MIGIYRHFYQSVSYQKGFSLVEIMLALTISLFLLAGFVQLFIGSKQTYRFSDGLSRLQENGRFAIDRLAFDIRMAGFRENISVLPPSDAVKIQSTDEDGDGRKDDRITIKYYDKTNSTNLLVGYFINKGASGRLALFRQENATAAQELIEGVEAMRIVSVPCVGSSSGTSVCSVRVDLLLVSAERNLATESQSVIFPPGTATTFTVPDRRLPQIFSTTVAIRNRPF